MVLPFLNEMANAMRLSCTSFTIYQHELLVYGCEIIQVTFDGTYATLNPF